MGSMLTASDIEDIVNDEIWDMEDDSYKDGGWYWFDELTEQSTPVNIARLGKVTRISIPDGPGDSIALVFRLEMADGSDRIFRMDGTYTSYVGTEFTGHLYEVQEKQKVVTVYE